MITLNATIKLKPKEVVLPISFVSGPTKSEISCELIDIITTKIDDTKPFILGVSKFGDGSVLVDSVGYFISKELSNENGEFSDDFCIVLNIGRDNAPLTIVFDKEVYPTYISINDIKYYSQSNVYNIIVQGKADTRLMKFGQLTKGNSPLIIKAIYEPQDLVIDYSRATSISFKRTYRGDNDFPSYGIISNVGNLEFNDYDNLVRGYAEQNRLVEDIEVDIFLANTLINKQEVVAKCFTNKWNYDEYNKKVSVSLKDNLEEWQNIYIEGFNYNPLNPNEILSNRTLKNLYTWLRDRTPSKYNMVSFEYLDSNTRNILSNTIIPYPLLEDGTLWEQWDKFCKVGALYIYKTKSGNTTCSYKYGS